MTSELGTESIKDIQQITHDDEDHDEDKDLLKLKDVLSQLILAGDWTAVCRTCERESRRTSNHHNFRLSKVISLLKPQLCELENVVLTGGGMHVFV